MWVEWVRGSIPFFFSFLFFFFCFFLFSFLLCSFFFFCLPAKRIGLWTKIFGFDGLLERGQWTRKKEGKKARKYQAVRRERRLAYWDDL